MSRPPRLNIAEGVYHVTQRGVEQRDIVVDDEDRQECQSNVGCAVTPTELRPIAQGCERSELPWVNVSTDACTPTGFRHRCGKHDATLSG